MQIYCDGSCKGNPGPGGWAAVFINQDVITKKINGYFADTTNNRMELTAAIEALKCLKVGEAVEIHTDSTYLKNGITVWIKSWKKSNWKNGKIKNIDLWKELDMLDEGVNVTWHWVKAHNGNKYNEMADYLAKLAVDEKVSYQTVIA